jgi:hypothetical protein
MGYQPRIHAPTRLTSFASLCARFRRWLKQVQFTEAGTVMRYLRRIFIAHTGNRDTAQYVIWQIDLRALDGRINTDPHTLQTNTDSPLLYSIGDCPAAFRPAVHNIFAAVPVLAANIIWVLELLWAGLLPVWLVWFIKGRVIESRQR